MITAVVTSMGRRAHLETTLEFTLAAFPETIVVDYSCPQKSGEYAASEGARVVYKSGERYYNGSKAKNYGAQFVTTEYVAFVDADGFCMAGLRDELESLLSQDAMILSARTPSGNDVNDTVGFLACKASTFRSVGGFDEVLWQGWGCEDIHLRGKLLLDAGLTVKRLSGGVLGSLRHGNELRSVNRPMPITESAISSHKVLTEWFEARGIPNFQHNALVKDIIYMPPTPNVRAS